jgi:hypothetical protein
LYLLPPAAQKALRERARMKSLARTKTSPRPVFFFANNSAASSRLIAPGQRHVTFMFRETAELGKIFTATSKKSKKFLPPPSFFDFFDFTVNFFFTVCRF